MNDGNNNSTDGLIAGIRKETEEERSRIEAEATKAVEERLAGARKQAQALLAEAERRADEQCRLVKREAEAATAAAVHRIALRAQDEFFQAALKRTAERIAELISSPDYARILEDWIVEAALGLGEERALANASAPERALLERVLPQAERQATELAGKKISLALSGEPPLGGQGILLTSGSGRTAFNNQVRTRMLRYETAVRKAIYDALLRERPRGEA